jgi:hypothetical protein
MRLLGAVVSLGFAVAAFAGTPPAGVLRTDTFIRGSSGLPATINVTYVSSSPANAAPADVTIVSSADVAVTPARLQLVPGTPAEVRLQFRSVDFAEEFIEMQSACCPPVRVDIEPGNDHQLALALPDGVSDDEPFDVRVSATDAKGNALKCRTALDLEVSVTRGQVRYGADGPWGSTAKAAVGPGNVLVALFSVRPSALLGGTGTVNATLRTSGKTVLLAKSSSFAISAHLLIDVVAAMVGAILFTLIRILSSKPVSGRSRFRNRGAEFGVALAAGAVAVILALGLDKAELGVNIDRTRPWGFAVLGLLLSFGGVETFLRRAMKSGADEKSAAAPTDIAQALGDLRRTIDKRFIGTAVEDKDSLYTYVENHVSPLYAGAHREQEGIVFQCRRVDQAAQFDLTLDTRLQPPALPGRPIEPIEIGYQEPLLPNITSVSDVRSRQLVELQLTLAGVRYRSNDERTLLVPENPAKLPNDFPKEIEIVVTVKERYAVFRYAVEVPESLTAKPFDYKARTVWFRPTDPDFFTFTVSRPTRVFTLVCNFPDDVLLQVGQFALTDKIDSESILPEPKLGTANVRMTDWLLPGHGVVVVWPSLAGAKSAS